MIATVAVGSGARAVVIEQIQSLGTNLVIVVSGASRVRGVRSAAGSQMTLTEDDARALKREIPAVPAAAPSMRGTVQIVYGNQNWSALAYGINNDYFRNNFV